MTWKSLLGAVFLQVACSVALAAAPRTPVDCVPAARQMLRQLDLVVPGDTRVTQNIAIPAGVAVLLEAAESDIDTRLEVREPGGEARSADNAIRRWVPQRAVVPAGPARTLEVSIVGQERAHGSARVRLYRLGAGEDPRCAQFWRTMAEADAQFSLGDMITEGRLEAAEGAGDEAYAAAVRRYADAHDAAQAHGLAGVSIAQAQLALAFTLLISTQEWEKTAATALAARDEFSAYGSEYGRDRARFYWARGIMQLARRTTDGARAKALFETARNEYLAVAESHQRRGERYDRAYALLFAAFVDWNADRYVESITDYQRALEAFQGLGEPARELQARANLASVEMGLGRYTQALEHYYEALREADPENELEQYFYFLKNTAFLEQRLGKYDSALRHLSEAIEVSVRAHNDQQKAFALHGLGDAYRSIGNLPEALTYLERALELRPADKLPRERSDTLRAIADVLGDLDRGREAIARREEALRLVQGPVVRTRVRLELIRNRINVGDLAVAKAQLADLMADPNLVDQTVRASATLENARLALAEKRLDVALRDSAAAAAGFRAQELIAREFDALLVSARAACSSGRRSEGLDFAARAMQRAEEVRISSNNPTLRAYLWRPLRPAFDFTITVLATPQSCGSRAPADPLAALLVAEKSRARALEDFRRRLDDASEPATTARRRELFEQMAARRQQIATIAETASQDDERLRILRAEVASLSREIDLAGAEIAPAPNAAGNAEKSLHARLAAIPADAAVVEYWVGDENAYAWLLTRGRVQLVDLGPSRRIDAAARELHEAMDEWTTRPVAQRIHSAQELHALIVAPLPAEFAKARTTYFIPDGALHTVPFAALMPAGTKRQFLLDSHDVAVAPAFASIGVAEAAPRILRSSPALVIADPVYTPDDSRLATRVAAVSSPGPTLRSARHWGRLPATAREAAVITRLLEPDKVDVLSGFEASRETLLQRNLDEYDVVHFAVHAVADTEAPQLSALILSTFDAAGRPRIGEVFAGDLLDRRMHASLVVLSGCETALGHAEAGEGLLGMRYAAHAAGARTVVASLWPVMDAAGATLMDGFYSAVIDEQMAPVAALSQAMRATRRKWDDPALWAPFDVSVTGF